MGGQKRLRRNKGRHSKTNKKCLFLGEKQFFNGRQRKERNKNKTKQTKKNKLGGFSAKWGGPSGHLTWPLNPPRKTKKTNHKKQTNKKQEREGGFRAKWGGQKQKKHKKKHKNPKNELFSYQSIFSFFGGCPKFPFFDNLAQKNAHSKNTIKIGVSAKHFLKNRSASQNGHFGTKKTKPEIPIIIFWGLFFSSSTRKTQESAEIPMFIVFNKP